MKISKQLKYPLSKTLTAVLSVNDMLTSQSSGYGVKRLYGSIKTADTEYDLDSIDEVVPVKESLSGTLKGIYFSITYEKDEEKLEVLFFQTSDSYLSLECSGSSIANIEELFSKLSSEVFKTAYYKHQPSSDTIKNQKKIIQTVGGILSCTDSLQVRSLGIINSEKDFQNFLYPILRSHFEDLEDEHYLPKYGVKTYKPDFGIPSGKLLIEVKFIKTKAGLKRIQSEIHDDVVGYLRSSDKYKKVIVAIYNFGNVAINSKELKQLEKTKGIESVVVCSHVIPNNLDS